MSDPMCDTSLLPADPTCAKVYALHMRIARCEACIKADEAHRAQMIANKARYIAQLEALTGELPRGSVADM